MPTARRGPVVITDRGKPAYVWCGRLILANDAAVRVLVDSCLDDKRRFG